MKSLQPGTGDNRGRCPVLSQDGTKIIFQSESIVSMGHHGFIQLFMMNCDGSNLTQLTTEKGIWQFNSFDPNISKDGRTILFSALGLIELDSTNVDLYKMEVGTLAQNATRLTFTPNTVCEWCPQWSPDEKLIVYYASDRAGNENSTIHLIRDNGSHPDTGEAFTSKQLNIDSYDYKYPSWSPDGEHIVFISNREGPDYAIYIMDKDGGNIKRVTNDPEAIPVSSELSWSKF